MLVCSLRIGHCLEGVSPTQRGNKKGCNLHANKRKLYGWQDLSRVDGCVKEGQGLPYITGHQYHQKQ